MSQHDLDVGAGSGAQVRADLNLALKALGSIMTGPIGSLSATFPNQLVADTTSGYILKRSNNNTFWEYLMPIDQDHNIAADSGTDAYSFDYNPPIASYINGMTYKFKADVNNTGASTLNICNVAAKAIRKYISNGDGHDLASNDIPANKNIVVQWNSYWDVFILMNPPVLMFPVGHLYLTVDSTNPATYLGYGTWVAFGIGHMPVGANPATETSEVTGGEYEEFNVTPVPGGNAIVFGFITIFVWKRTV